MSSEPGTGIGLFTKQLENRDLSMSVKVLLALIRTGLELTSKSAIRAITWAKNAYTILLKNKEIGRKTKILYPIPNEEKIDLCHLSKVQNSYTKDKAKLHSCP